MLSWSTGRPFIATCHLQLRPCNRSRVVRKGHDGFARAARSSKLFERKCSIMLAVPPSRRAVATYLRWLNTKVIAASALILFVAFVALVGRPQNAIAVEQEMQPDFDLAYQLAVASYCAYSIGELDPDHGYARAVDCLKAAAAADPKHLGIFASDIAVEVYGRHRNWWRGDHFMNLLSWINFVAAASAFVAAFFWFWSAIVKTPQQFRITAATSSLGGPIGGGPVGGGEAYPATSKDLKDLAAALKKQSRLSAIAAVFAGIAASPGVLVYLIEHFG
jgi:hypothetical protein